MDGNVQHCFPSIQQKNKNNSPTHNLSSIMVGSDVVLGFGEKRERKGIKELEGK